MASETRLRVAHERRAFCESGESGDREPCGRPSYPRNEKRLELGCKGFRCSRCKETVGWCRGCAHEPPEHPANNWCDDCYVEVYVAPADAAKKALRRFRVSIRAGDTVEPSIVVTTARPRRYRTGKGDQRIVDAVREAGIRCPVIIDGVWRE